MSNSFFNGFGDELLKLASNGYGVGTAVDKLPKPAPAPVQKPPKAPAQTATQRVKSGLTGGDRMKNLPAGVIPR
ncbi:MAG: hypothetical protein ACYTBJ_05370 [Planctomycetota bacterium]|jgi:hypothetical protein